MTLVVPRHYREAVRRKLTLGGLALLACLGSTAAVADAQTARIALQQVFGQPATSLTIAFGGIDASCISPPASGVTCVPDAPSNGAIWHGAIQFLVRVTGAPGVTTRLVGARTAAGSVPAGQLLDGPLGVPTIPYPISPAAPLVLATAIGTGNTTITRRFGLKVVPGNAAGAWSTQTVYSLIVE